MDLIKRKIDSLINRFGTSCPFKLAKHLGIYVQYENLGNALGYYSKHFRIPIIHINETAGEKQQIFICAHELGHAVFHPDANTPFLKKHTLFSTEKIEKEANMFAVNLLFSRDSIDDQYFINDIVESYGIPEKFLLSNLYDKIF